MADNTEGAMTDMEKGHQVGQSNTPSTVSPYDPTPEQLYGAPTYPAFTPVAPTAEPKQWLADIRRHTNCMYSCGIAYGILGTIAGVSCLFTFSGGFSSLGVGACLIMFSIVLAVVGVVASKNKHPTVMLIVGIFLVLLSILAIAYALYLIYVIYVAGEALFAFRDEKAKYINTLGREPIGKAQAGAHGIRAYRKLR